MLRRDAWRPIDPDALFDLQIKRIHEYKRQLLNILETATLYRELRDDPGAAIAPRVKIIGGKAAPGYERAKLIIKLAYDVGRTIEANPHVRDRLQLIFVPNYSVTLAESLIPAADLSEQISTAGMEASGTGNMKLALNGALTIGTLDGANIEIRERVGASHFFAFGMTAAEVERRKQERFEGATAMAASPRLAAVVEAIAQGEFSNGDRERYAPLVAALQGGDPFMTAADFDNYWATQRAIDRAWQDAGGWARSSIHNISGMGFFSSDRAVREYARDIWHVEV
jgi:starch phosphorylase